MCIKNDVVVIVLNVVEKMKIVKWMLCLVLLFLVGIVLLEVIKIDNISIIVNICRGYFKCIRYINLFNF